MTQLLKKPKTKACVCMHAQTDTQIFKDTVCN